MCCDQHENTPSTTAPPPALQADGLWRWTTSTWGCLQHVARLWQPLSLWPWLWVRIGPSPLHLVKQDLSSSLRHSRLCHPFIMLSRALATWASTACSPGCIFWHPISRGTKNWGSLSPSWCLTPESLISVWHQWSIISAQALLWFSQHKHHLGTTDKRQRGQSREPSSFAYMAKALQADVSNPLMRSWWLLRAGAREARDGGAQASCTEAPGMPYTNKPIPPGSSSHLFVTFLETCANYRQNNVGLERKLFLNLMACNDNILELWH